MHTLTRILVSAAPAAGLLLVVACGNTVGPPPPRNLIVVDTTALFALDGTAIGLPSAYNMLIPGGPAAVNTEHEVTGFDFVFNITAGGQAVLLPTGAIVGLSKGSGLQLTGQQFDSIRTAPSAGYADSTAVDIQPGSVVIVRSRPTTCDFGATVFEYAKIRVLAVDTVARRMDMEILDNWNCGYRDLQPGYPAH